MSDLENNAQEKGTKKRPYNLREKKEKDAARLCYKRSRHISVTTVSAPYKKTSYAI